MCFLQAAVKEDAEVGQESEEAEVLTVKPEPQDSDRAGLLTATSKHKVSLACACCITTTMCCAIFMLSQWTLWPLIASGSCMCLPSVDQHPTSDLPEPVLACWLVGFGAEAHWPG